MKKFLGFIFVFMLFISSNVYAANYVKDVKVTRNDNSTKIDIITTEPIKYNVGKLDFNKKIYFDLQNTITRTKIKKYVNDGNMTTVRVAQNTVKPNYISRVVFDMIDMEKFSTRLSSDKKTLSVSFKADATSRKKDENLRKKTIVLDPGHGGKDPGAMISDLIEKELNLDISQRVKKLLENDGRFNVYMTRDKDVFIPLLDRSKFANDKKADLFVSIHNNSMPKEFSGTMILYNNTKIAGNKALAESFQDIVGEASGLKGIGARCKDKIAVLRTINMPGVLVEVACMSNIKDRRELRKEGFKEDIAQSIYEAIVKATI